MRGRVFEWACNDSFAPKAEVFVCGVEPIQGLKRGLGL